LIITILLKYAVLKEKEYIINKIREREKFAENDGDMGTETRTIETSVRKLKQNRRKQRDEKK
jgi:hypothetical protein